MKIYRMSVCLLALLLMLAPALAFAEVVGETALSFPLEAEREHITLYSVELTRSAEMLSLDVIYSIPEDLSEAERALLKPIEFYLKAEAVDAELVSDFYGASTQPLDPEATDMDLPAGESFLDHTEFPPIDAFPEKLYLRPYYTNLGEWGAAIELDFTRATIVPIENTADLPVAEFLPGGDSNG